MATFIDPKTLKKCNHRWEPVVNEVALVVPGHGWSLHLKCRRCDAIGGSKQIKLRKLLEQLG